MIDEEESGISSKGLLIQGSDFVLKAIDEASYAFDLYLLKVVNKGKENQKYGFKIYAYGVELSSAINHIIQYRVRKRQSKFTGKGDEGLVNYYKIWCEEKTKLLKLFDFSEEEWKSLTRIKKATLEINKERHEAEQAEKDKIKAERKAEREEAKKAAKEEERLKRLKSLKKED
jgi:hypothetical protein